MPRKTSEERTRTIFELARKAGMEEKYAAVLAGVAVKRRLGGRVAKLLTVHGHDYAEMMRMNAEMWADPVAFRQKAIGSKALRRFATLSLTYSDASPVQMVLRLLKDAKLTRIFDSGLREAGDFDGRHGSSVYIHDLFWELRAGEKEAAFYADMRGNGIDRGYTGAILQEIRYQELPSPGYDWEGSFNRLTALSSVYRFFESPEGREYRARIRREKDPAEAKQLQREVAAAFSHAYRNNPQVNKELGLPSETWVPEGRSYNSARLIGFDENYQGITEPLDKV